MKWNYIAVLGLILLHVLSDLFVSRWLVWDSPADWPLWLHHAALMLGPAQGCLLAVWAAFRGGDTSWRVFLVVSAITGYAWVLPCFLLQPTLGLMRAWLATLLLQFLFLLAVMLFGRFVNLRLVGNVSENDNGVTNRFQCTLRQMFFWLTTFAVLAAFPYQLPWRIALSDNNEWAILGQIIVGSVSLLLVWLLLGPGRLALRFPVAILMLGIVTYFWQLPLSLLPLQVGWIACSLFVVRFAGYRLEWVRTDGGVPLLSADSDR